MVGLAPENMSMQNTDKAPGNFERRKDRVFREGFKWFYHIRGGQRGPFDARQAALNDLAEFSATMRYLEEHPDSFPQEVDVEDLTHIDLKTTQY